MALHALLEDRNDVAVVRLLRELQLAAVLHEGLELAGLVQAELVQSHLLLLSLNVVVFLVLRAAGEALPGEGSAQEIQKHVSNGLQVITTRLLDADMGRDGGVASGTCQVLALTVRDVLALRVLVALGQTEVNDVDVVLRALAATHQEVVWLDVTVDDALLVHFPNAVDLKAHNSVRSIFKFWLNDALMALSPNSTQFEINSN